MIYIGIDWADQEHHVFITNDLGANLGSFAITHSVEGFAKLEDRVKGLSSDQKGCLFALEIASGLLVGYLLAKGYTVYPINPKAVDRYRDRYRVSGAKSDPGDAMVLSHILRTDRPRHQPLMPSSELARELLLLTRDHQNLVQQRTRLVNQLNACLKEYYPAALQFFSSVDQPLALAFLNHFPTPGDAQRLSLQELEAFCFKHHYHNRKDIKRLYNKLQLPMLQAHPFVVRAKSRYLLSLISQLIPLQQSIKEYEGEIECLFKRHPDSEIFLSLPGAGKTIAPQMLAEIGDRRENFPHCEFLQAEAGTAPVTKRSGGRIMVVFRRSCRKRLRNTLQQFALESLKFCPWAREYYKAQKQRGKSTSQALRALANRWLAIIWVMWQRDLPYDDEYHQANRDKRRCQVDHDPVLLKCVTPLLDKFA